MVWLCVGEERFALRVFLIMIWNRDEYELEFDKDGE